MQCCGLGFYLFSSPSRNHHDSNVLTHKGINLSLSISCLWIALESMEVTFYTFQIVGLAHFYFLPPNNRNSFRHPNSSRATQSFGLAFIEVLKS